ncbi:hypothetical protein TWF281_011410 [Arthrobotrys megalospora]
MSSPSKDPETASQLSNNPWAVNFDTGLNELNLELQSPAPTVSPPERPVFTPSEPVTVSEIVTRPEPATLVFSPPHTATPSVRSIQAPSALYYCRYSEDGTRSEVASQLGREFEGIEGYRVFREQDFGNSRVNILSPPVEESTTSPENGEVDVGNDSSPAITITPSGDENTNGEFEKVVIGSTETVVRNVRRSSRFTEILVSEDGEDEGSTVFEEKSDTTEDLPSSDRAIYIHAPWILRFIYIFILANWWSLIPLMKVSSNGFHPENLPIVYSCVMLSIVIINLGLQINFFRLYGAPWGHRRQAEKLRDAAEYKRTSRRLCLPFGAFTGSNGSEPCDGVDLESDRNMSRATLRKDRNRRKWRMRTGMESYVFAVDAVLFVLTLAVLGVSIVIARHGRMVHEVQMMQEAARVNGTLADKGSGRQTAGVELYGDDDGYKLKF